MDSPAIESQSLSARVGGGDIVKWRFPTWLAFILLAAGTVAAYWPATRCQFVNYDDPAYVTLNLEVQKGLTLDGIKWALVNPVASNWHPLTMLSHMLDCQLYGLNPWGHHLSSVLLHAANAGLIFVLLRGLTGAVWRSLLVAALFAVHPLRVESVAWISERKDVLSSCLGLLALIFYTRYVQKRLAVETLASGENASDGSAPAGGLDYGLTFFFLTLGLMSKAMLVTWPFVMLLLDYWPLERFKARRVWPLVREKIPFFVLVIVMSVVTFLVQRDTGAVQTIENVPVLARGGNALVSYCRYLYKMMVPIHLAAIYPESGYWPLAVVAGAGIILVAITGLLWVKRRQYPFLLMGWLWYCGTLVPVIGLVQVGQQAMADRYTYIPSLGMMILVVWGVYEIIGHRRYLLIPVAVVFVAGFVVCVTLTQKQIGYWQDGESLFRQAVKVTKDSYYTQTTLGQALDLKGKVDEAMLHYREALRLNPQSADTHDYLGLDLYAKGDVEGAIREYLEAIRLKPDASAEHNDLGNALDSLGRTDEAISEYEEAVRLKPDFAEAHVNLGAAYGKKGKVDQAILQLQEATHLQPDNVLGRYNLGAALEQSGRTDEAIHQYQEALRLKPDFVEASNSLANALETKKDPAGPK